MAESKFIRDAGCKEAVCIDAGRVYDSCCDKDCIENMRLFFTEREQMLVDHATGIRAKKAEIITTYIDVEALPFNRGYYSCDLTFFFDVEVEVYGGHGCPCNVLHGVGVFRKKVILYGSEGHVRVFHSEYTPDAHDRQEMPTRNMPRCCVQVAEPVVLDGKLVDCCDRCRYDCGDCGCIPGNLCSRYGGNFVDAADSKIVVVTLGIFTIVQLIRNVQMLMPVYDYCMPNKECTPTSENPCDLFNKMSFPVNEFFPPATEGDGCSCACGSNTTSSNSRDNNCRRSC